MSLHSWGRLAAVTPSQIINLDNRDKLPAFEERSGEHLAYGMGRSYGDVPLLEGGVALMTAGLDRIISFDSQSGVVECEAGVSIAELHDWSLRLGWFMPVTPGTKYVSIGGAVANDVHGKNHHADGTFGRYVRTICLLRSGEGLVECSLENNPDLFKATIGGLGLTGLIISVSFSLKKVAGPYIDAETIKFHNLNEFFAIDDNSKDNYPYTMAWVDCLARGKQLGRGLYMRGKPSSVAVKNDGEYDKFSKLVVPFDLPNLALNPLTMKLFNFAYYHKQLQQNTASRCHYEPFFYPLDAVRQWNRIYGKRGFYQLQFTLPESERERIISVFEKIATSRMGSFLAVLKRFGDLRSPGILSYPSEGVTLALDFANTGKRTLSFLQELTAIVKAGGGRIYPAKDAMMSPGDFRQFYPNYQAMQPYRDRKFNSNFWQRVEGDK